MNLYGVYTTWDKAKEAKYYLGDGEELNIEEVNLDEYLSYWIETEKSN